MHAFQGFSAGFVLLCTSLFCSPAGAETGRFSEQAAFRFTVSADEEFLRVGPHSLTADVYVPNNRQAPHPLVLLIHGGGWVYNTKGHVTLQILPWLEKGFAVANINYRRTGEALAPAAVQDTICALKWLAESRERFQLDPKKVIATGSSAGGHLALMAAFAPTGEFDQPCPGGKRLPVAAVVNWWGISDVSTLLSGADAHDYAIEWIGRGADAQARAKRVSPVTWLPMATVPVLSIHGDADRVVPFSQSQHLHHLLQQRGGRELLVRVPGRGHGDFSPAEVAQVFPQIWDFLERQQLMPGAPLPETRP